MGYSPQGRKESDTTEVPGRHARMLIQATMRSLSLAADKEADAPSGTLGAPDVALR